MAKTSPIIWRYRARTGLRAGGSREGCARRGAPAATGQVWCGLAVSRRTCAARKRVSSTPTPPRKAALCCASIIPGTESSAFDTPGGRFEDGAIGDWLEQSLALFEVSTRGPQILIGTSMGAWIALLLARRLNEIRASRPTARAAAAGSRGRFHRGIAMEDASRGGSAADRGKGRICAAIPLWADPDAHHPAPGGGGSRPPFAWRSGARPCADAHHSGSVGRGRALASRAGPRGSFGGRPGDDFPRLRRGSSPFAATRSRAPCDDARRPWIGARDHRQADSVGSRGATAVVVPILLDTLLLGHDAGEQIVRHIEREEKI